MSTITFGLHVGQQDISADELRRLWRWADENGFGWFSIWDHHYPVVNNTSPHYEAVALLGALAIETRNLRFGCMVFAVQYRNLGVLARAMLTVDHLSGGRVEFGLGAGWHEPEYKAFGVEFLPVKERLDQMEEGMRAMRSLLDNESTTFHGQWTHLEDARMNLRPVSGKLPLWVGGGGERRTARIAARYADGWNIPYISPEVYRHKMQVLENWCEKEGRDPTEIARATQLGFFMAPSDDAATVEAATDKLRRQFGRRVSASPDGHLLGSPAAVIEQIAAYRDAGVTALNLAIRPPVDWEALEVFVAEVMPALENRE